MAPAGQGPALPPPSKAINSPGVKEPEDIFADIKEPELQNQAAPPSQNYSAAAPVVRGFPWRVVLGIGIPLVILGLGLGGWYVYTSYTKANNKVTPPVVKENTPNVPVTNVPDNTPSIPNPITPPDEDKLAAQQAAMTLLQFQAENGMAESPTSSIGVTATSSETVTATSPVAPPNIPLPAAETSGISNAALPAGIDTDQDGLTNSEEGLLGSDPTNRDTNGNSYPDLTEVVNGYDPVVAGSKLSNSSSLKTELIGTLNIQIPKVWDRRPGQSGTVQILTGTPAVITAEIRPFATDKTLLEMVIQDNPNTSREDYSTDKTGSGLDVVYSKDGMSAWLLVGNSVYLFRYNVNAATSKDFESIFKDIIVKQAKVSRP